MPSKVADYLESLLSNKRVQAFLETISFSEGTTKYGYHTFVGNTPLQSIEQHPNRAIYLGKDKAGKPLYSSASGKYQFIQKTWRATATKLGLTSFNARNQDIAALELIREKGALADVVAGNFQSAIFKTRKVWASFPGAGYNQNEHSIAKLEAFYKKKL